MADRILTLHPDPDKHGVNIERAKYDLVHAAIIASFRERGEMSFTELSTEVAARLRGQFVGSITWYVVTVKLDMEARKQIRRAPGTQPARLRLASARTARG